MTRPGGLHPRVPKAGRFRWLAVLGLFLMPQMSAAASPAVIRVDITIYYYGCPNPCPDSTYWFRNYPTPVLVTILDANGNSVPDYTGTVSFTSTDPLATLPPPYTFTTTDAGQHYFTSILFQTLGTQTITLTDAGNGITGSYTILILDAAFNAAIPTTTLAGTAALIVLLAGGGAWLISRR